MGKKVSLLGMQSSEGPEAASVFTEWLGKIKEAGVRRRPNDSNNNWTYCSTCASKPAASVGTNIVD